MSNIGKVIPVQVLKAYAGSEYISPLILNLETIKSVLTERILKTLRLSSPMKEPKDP